MCAAAAGGAIGRTGLLCECVAVDVVVPAGFSFQTTIRKKATIIVMMMMLIMLLLLLLLMMMMTMMTMMIMMMMVVMLMMTIMKMLICVFGRLLAFANRQH